MTGDFRSRRTELSLVLGGSSTQFSNTRVRGILRPMNSEGTRVTMEPTRAIVIRTRWTPWGSW